MFTHPETQNPEKKLYWCQYCPRSFRKPSALQPHIYSHTGEKPFSCHIADCNRSYSTLSNLRRHFKVHNKRNRAPSFGGGSSKHQQQQQNRLLAAIAPENHAGGDNSKHFHNNNSNNNIVDGMTAPKLQVTCTDLAPPSLSVISQSRAAAPAVEASAIAAASAAVCFSYPLVPMPTVALHANARIPEPSHRFPGQDSPPPSSLITPTVTGDPPSFGCEEWATAPFLPPDISDLICLGHNNWLIQ